MDYVHRHSGKPGPALYLNWFERARLWFSRDRSRLGYLSYDSELGEAVIFYCDPEGRPVLQIRYHRVRNARRLLLAVGSGIAWLRPFGQVVIDTGHNELHALIYQSATGQIYLRIPSVGWFISPNEPRKPTIWTERYITCRIFSDDPNPEATRRAARRRISLN